MAVVSWFLLVTMDIKTSVAVLFVVCLAPGVLSCMRSSKSDQTTTPGPTTPSTSAWQCGYCGPPIDVTLRVRNELNQSKLFDISYTLKSVNKQALLYLLLQAANENVAFKFSMTHFGELGMFVDAINGVKNNFSTAPRAYWKILYANGTAYDIGVSSIIPEDGDEIVFDYTKFVPGGH